MNIFELHKNIIEDYENYILSFINIKDKKIRDKVLNDIGSKKLWPEPLVQFNPSFEKGESIQSLCNSGKLQSQLADTFKEYVLHKHQVEAILTGADGKDFIVTSGTGSGKSLTYIGTIFNFLFANLNQPKGIKAVIVYPMNALINSQFKEIEGYKKYYEDKTNLPFPINFEQYTGQEPLEEKKRISQSNPDIILTNYMMLELILTRPQEEKIKDSIFKNLRYLVFDELHTYRGRQGSDVAMLIRRIKAKCKNKINFIGTSATMVSGKSISEQKVQVAKVATKIFGVAFNSAQVINEFLRKSLLEKNVAVGSDELKTAVINQLPTKSAEDLLHHPLANWLETEIALSYSSDGVLVRNKPMTLQEISKVLSAKINLEEETCLSGLMNLLLQISRINQIRAKNQESFLPFKLHQFLSQTGSVYSTLEQDENRYLTLEPGFYKGTGDEKRPLFPVVFSRNSGHEFLCVKKADSKFEPREFSEILSEEEEEDADGGYLICGNDVWNEAEDLDLLPDWWKEFDKKTGVFKRLKKTYRNRIPLKVYFDEFGNYSEEKPMKFQGWYMSKPLLFDPTSGAFFDPKTSERTKLTQLGNEGRSTSTTVTSFSILKHLKSSQSFEEQKVLSFTDNRQDASLQAGHFNDFIDTVKIRSAIWRALMKAPDEQLDHTNISNYIFEALNLQQAEYAKQESTFSVVKTENERALKDFLFYRTIDDLRKSWRVVLPNLEQCALLEFDYRNLKAICEDAEPWRNVFFMNEKSAEEKALIVYQLLEYFRKSFAVYHSEYLDAAKMEEKRKFITEKLKAPYCFEENESLRTPRFVNLETLQENIRLSTVSAGVSGGIGKFLRAKGLQLRGEDYKNFIRILLDLLVDAQFLRKTLSKNKKNEPTNLYQLNIHSIIWKKGNETTLQQDELKFRAYKDFELKPNEFFKEVYKTNFEALKTWNAAEHTGQLKTEDRKMREEEFREGRLKALYCSPTMELGIDISSLNVVHMRNVPPNPSNYAQRSGRAGRSGQAALVFTYCSNYSAHDKHYFRKRKEMVSGTVAPPRIDICNQELLRSHLHAIVLSEIGLTELKESLGDLMEEHKIKNLPLKEEIKKRLDISAEQKESIKKIFKRAIEDFTPELQEKAKWFNENWIDRNLDRVEEEFDKSLNRWRTLFQNAKQQLAKAQAIINDSRLTNSSIEKRQAFRDEKQATSMIDKLKNANKSGYKDNSEFYPYRYLASEGFLPGYNFTRLPLRTLIPIGDDSEFISRPRFVALREFGPGNIIYHNGKKYRIEKLQMLDINSSITRAKVSHNTGYFLEKQEFDFTVDPVTNVPLTNHNTDYYLHLLEMGETKTKENMRITCEEEERIKQGFDIKTFFSIPGGIDTVREAKVRNVEAELLHLRFIPTAKLVHVNEKLRSKREDSFWIDKTFGDFRAPSENHPEPERFEKVQFYTYDTADALYIEPIAALALDEVGVLTLQYALKRAIENVFQIESNEIGVTLMGGDHPNIFLYESAQGSLGILSQFMEDKEKFNEVIDEAIRVCRFDEEEYKDPASYDDLLSYYNQRDHKIIDRYKIEEALKKLSLCKVELKSSIYNEDYEVQYERLLKSFDTNSETELRFLKFLYKNGYRLPDKAQARVEGIYSQPDFFYAPDVHVFCDGTPHDKADAQERDTEIRAAIRNKGEQVVVYYYKDELEKLVQSRPDVFKKVK